MFRGGLWESASNAFVKFNENISNALDNLDKDGEENDTNEGEEVAESELETYKKLLEDAQMSQVDLSKQSRLLLAEKEAEVSYWKKKALGDASSESDKAVAVDDALKLEKLVSEKLAVEDNLKLVEERLRKAMHDLNAVQVESNQWTQLNSKYSSAKQDLIALRAELEDKENQKNETIDSLVAEYSKLAADTERQHNKDLARIQAVERENEVLATKMHALEINISDLADRSTYKQDRSETPTDEAVLALQQELREFRSKVVNLQFDKKELETEIAKLRVDLESVHSQQKTSANGVPTSPSKASGEMERLRKEVQEWQDTARDLQSQVKSLQETIQRLEKDGASSGSANASATCEVHSLQLQLSAMQDARAEESQRLQNEARQLEVMLSETRESLFSMQKTWNEREKTLVEEAERLKDLLSCAERRLNDSEQSAAASKERLQLSACEEVSVLKAQLLSAQVELTAMKASHGEELASRSAETSALHARGKLFEEDSEKERTSLKRTIRELEDEVLALKTASVSQAAGQEEMAALMTSKLQQQKERFEEDIRQLETNNSFSLTSLRADLEASAKAAIEELKRQGDAASAALREMLQAEHSSALQKKLEECRREGESLLSAQRVQLLAEKDAALQDAAAKHSNELTARDSEYSSKINLLEDTHRAAVAALVEQHEKQIEEVRNQLMLAHSKDMEDLQAANAVQLTDSLAKQHREDVVAMEAALQQQQEAHATSMAATIARLSEEKRCELSDLSRRLTEEKEQAVASVRAEAASEIDAANVVLENTRSQLQALQDSFETEKRRAIAAAEAQKDAEKMAELERLRQEMKKLIDEAIAEKNEFQQLYTKESKLRKAIHNKLLEIQGNIRVICRVRPVLDMERKVGEDVDVTSFPSTEEVTIQRDPVSKSRFEYDRVFAPGSDQLAVFEAVQPLCVSVLDGYNVCIFAYGQTGSGKTYTMDGYGDEIGVSPRAIVELFRVTDSLAETWSFTLTFSMLEIYNENIFDLLDSTPTKEKLDVRQTNEGNVVPGLKEIVVTTPEQVEGLMSEGKANRAVGSHDMNEHSSRSHSILTMVCRGKNKIDGSTTFGKLHLIDLAGSERLSKTDATGDRLKEAQNINRSLSALGDVIAALGNKKATHIPYRNSKLTFLLQDSLGGNSKVLMFVNISPAIYNVGETLCSLNFASRCRNIELGQAKKQIGSSSSSSNINGNGEDSSAGNGGGVGGGGGVGLTSSVSTNSLATIASSTAPSASRLLVRKATGASSSSDASNGAAATPSIRRTSMLPPSASKR